MKDGKAKKIPTLSATEIEFFKYIQSFFDYIGEDWAREGLIDTPYRVMRSWKELFNGYTQKIKNLFTVFDSENYDEMIVLKDIEFYSTCEHHLLPFFGKVNIGYLPNGKIVGISKLARVVEAFSRRLQNQERLTTQIAEAINTYLKPKGVIVTIEAKHFCMISRGVAKQNSLMGTSKILGEFKKDATTRNEFFALLSKGG